MSWASKKSAAANKKSAAKSAAKRAKRRDKSVGGGQAGGAAGRLYQQLRKHREMSLQEPIWSGLEALTKASIQAWLVSAKVVYRDRWHSELDLRSIKCALHMDVLRCKTPAMIEKEVAIHFVADNLIRHLMSTSAQTHDTTVRELSFTSTRNLAQAFHLLLLACPEGRLKDLVNRLLQAISEHPTGKRPNRYEPRQQAAQPNPTPP